MLRACWLAFVLAGLAFALDPHKSIKQFVHTAWTEQDGAPHDIRALAQTTDGYLWLGTLTDLFRFDGIRFTRFEPLRGEEIPHSIRALHATPDGSLWIVFSAGSVSRLRDGHVTSYSEKQGFPSAFGLTQDADGSIVAGTARGLMRFKDGFWSDMGKALHFPGKEARLPFYDRSGGLWVVSEDHVNYLPPNKNRFEVGVDWIGPNLEFPFAQSPDGTMWLAELGRSAHSVRIPGSLGTAPASEVRVGATCVLFDRDGSLWIGSLGDGLRRIARPDRFTSRSIAQFGPEAEQYNKQDGLSAGTVHAGLEDREGNIWWGTARGLDRFRDAVFTPVSIPDADQPRTIAATRDGNLWTGAMNTAGILRIDPEGDSHVVKSVSRIYSLFEDEAGALWTSSNIAGVARLGGSGLVRLPLPRWFDVWDITGMTRDHSGAWWFYNATQGLFRFADGKLTSVDRERSGTGGSVYQDHLGRVWVGRLRGVTLCQNGSVRDFQSKDDLPAGRVFTFQDDHKGNLWAGGEGGLSKFENGSFQQVSGGLPRGIVYGMVEDLQNFWWLATEAGVVRVEARELYHAAADIRYRVRYDSFNLLDGMPGFPRTAYPMPIMARTTDGRVWFACSNGLAFADPKRIPRNPLAPPVQIEAVRVNGKEMRASDRIELGKDTNDLEIAYTALSLSIPERVRFRYKLEGAESDWRDADTRRRAFYNHLGPRKYRFRVIACNNDGVWNEAGASWDFSIRPAFYQTAWFKLLCILGGMSVLAGGYKLRMRQVAAAIDARFDERLNERTRLARDLHDTLIQTIQGSKLVADQALEECTDLKTRAVLGRLQVWLEQAMQEGRSALNSLRTLSTHGDSLVEAFRRSGAECLLQHSMKFEVSADGVEPKIHPVVYDEVYRIGHEAIRNAATHSAATRLDVELSFTDSLILRVRDNGKGFDLNLNARGAGSHFGLVGMRERASRIGGQLKFKSYSGRGTEVELIVPHKTAFDRLDRAEEHFET